MREYDSVVEYPPGKFSKSNTPFFHRRINWCMDYVVVGILERMDFRILRNFAMGVFNCKKNGVQQYFTFALNLY